jgi:hypothetical protein
MKALLILILSIISSLSYGQFISTSNKLNIVQSASNISPKNYYTPTNNNNANKKNRFAPPTTVDKVYIDFVGSGDIQKSFSEGKEINANTGLGIIFERYNNPSRLIQSYEIEGTITIASTADTITANIQNNSVQNRRSFGTYILNPVSARQSLYVNSNVYFGYPSEHPKFSKLAAVVSGFNIRFISSNNIWKYKDTVTNLGALALRVGFFHEFIPDNYRITSEGKSKYSLYCGIYYTYRGIFGDLSFPSQDELRKKILGSSQTQFNGIETSFGFRLNNIRAEFQMPVLKSINNSIDGLTNSQFLFSLKFVGGFSLKIEPTNSQNNNQQNNNVSRS